MTIMSEIKIIYSMSIEANEPLLDDRPRTSEDGRSGPMEPIREQPHQVVGVHNISIEPMDYGYLVRVGCQRFAVEKTKKLIKKLEKYLNDPEKVQREWLREKKF